MPGPRITPQTAAVLGALLDREHAWGFEIGRATGLKAGTIYPILARLEGAGWLESQWNFGQNGTHGLGGRRQRQCLCKYVYLLEKRVSDAKTIDSEVCCL